jgi:NAD(P)-dependent dehydrogenase (short-subunit alcohol dehydrogenase family)
MTAFRNKTALVTGASRGIGHATAAALAEAGARVLVHYGRSKQEAESLVAAIQQKGGRADAISADLETPNGASQLAERVRSIVGERLDVVVLNAGVGKSARIADYTVEEFGHLLASRSEDQSVKLWDVQSRREVATLKGHGGWVSSVAFSPDGRMVASGTNDYPVANVTLWSGATDEELAYFYRSPTHAEQSTAPHKGK